MATVKKELNPSDLSVHLRIEKDVRVATVTHKDGLVIVRREPFASSAFELELTRVLAGFGVEPEHELAATRDELERDRANAVRELAEIKGLFHKEQSLTGELSEKVAELEGERVSLTSRLAGVERERSELRSRLEAYDAQARQLAKLRTEEADNGPKTNPGGMPPQQ